MRRKRVLVVVSISFAVRYIVRTGLLDRMRSFCEPVVALTWQQDDLIAELRSKGYEVHLVPAPERAAAYSDIRRKIDIWFDAFCLKSSSGRIQQAYLNQYKKRGEHWLSAARELYNRAWLIVPSTRKELFAREAQLLQSATNFTTYLDFAAQLHIDAVFTVTPFHRQEDLLLRACSKLGKQMMTSILSFDNITKRGWIPVAYDLYMVWNKDNKEQLHRIYPVTKNTPVHITGAAQFDFYNDQRFLMPVLAWKQLTGLPAGNERKIILYAGGPGMLFPDEPQYLLHLDEAITSGVIKNNPVVLFRCHPVDDIERWKKALVYTRNIIFDHSWPGRDVVFNANVTKSDIEKLCSTLAYTDVHINLCSTMTVDGSVFDKPQIGPAYDAVNPDKQYLLQNMYLQEHFVPITHSGGLQLVTSKQQMTAMVNDALENPGKFSAGRKQIVTAIITYTDGRSTARVSESIKAFIEKENQ